MNAQEVIKAINDRDVESWSEDQLRQGIAKLHAESRLPDANFYNAYIQTLRDLLNGIERRHFADKSNQQLAAMKDTARHGEEIISRLREQHKIHCVTKDWAIIGGIAGIIAALTGIALVCFECVREWRGGDVGQHIETKQPPKTQPDASASSQTTTTTNTAATRPIGKPTTPEN